MSNISDYRFVLYERLASQKLNEILSQLNSHNHGSSGGVSIDIAGGIADGTIPGSKIVNYDIDTLQLADNSVTTPKIAAGAVTLLKLGSDIHLSPDGYAVYSP